VCSRFLSCSLFVPCGRWLAFAQTEIAELTPAAERQRATGGAVDCAGLAAEAAAEAAERRAETEAVRQAEVEAAEAEAEAAAEAAALAAAMGAKTKLAAALREAEATEAAREADQDGGQDDGYSDDDFEATGWRATRSAIEGDAHDGGDDDHPYDDKDAAYDDDADDGGYSRGGLEDVVREVEEDAPWRGSPSQLHAEQPHAVRVEKGKMLLRRVDPDDDM